MSEKKIRDKNEKLTSETLAELIIDALVDAQFVEKAKFNEAVKVAAMKIDIRKAMGDY